MYTVFHLRSKHMMKLDSFCAGDKENDYEELQESTKEDLIHYGNSPQLEHACHTPLTNEW